MAITVIKQGSKAPVHAESVRIGIKLACRAMQGQLPPPEIVEGILSQGGAELTPYEFPLDLIGAQVAQRRDLRRTYAIKAMEVLLHQAGDSVLRTVSDMERLVDSAWSIAAQMERHDNVASSLDTLKD